MAAIGYCRADETGPAAAAVALNDIKTGETISYLLGEIVTTQQMLERFRRDGLSVDVPHQITSNLYILLDHRSSLFGHSCSPNAAIHGHNELFALRDMVAGERITYDFSTAVGTSSYDSLWRSSCKCGAPNCRKTLGSILTIPIDIIRGYSIAGALPDFIIEELRMPGNHLLK